MNGHAIIAGFGVPGRAVGEVLAARNTPFIVIELNPTTVDRCAHRGMHMVKGDVRDPQTLRQACVERASLVAVTVPNDETALIAVRNARELNPTAHIMVRCHFISNGMEAHKLGANEVVIEEQVVAQEFLKLMKKVATPVLETT